MNDSRPPAGRNRKPAARPGKSAPGKRAPAPRPRGRPAGGDDPDLRGRLLDAALQCFARDGVGGTSLRAIAQAAGATPAMLHYYFGDKAQLLAALVAERFQPAIDTVRAPLLAADVDDPQVLVRGFVQAMMRIIEANPWLPPLWVREVLSEGGAFRDLLVDAIGPQVPKLLAARFAAMRDAGRLPAGVDPALLVASLVGLTMFTAASAPIWSRLFDARLGTAQIEAHALALLDAAIAPVAGPAMGTAP